MKLVKALFGIFCMVLLSSVAIAAPAANCQNIAAGKDNGAQAKATEYSATYDRLNPCTGDYESADRYREPTYNGITEYRYVFESGDTFGSSGMARYVLCQDGRASVHQVIAAYYNRGIAWGFWLYSPFSSPTGPWTKELCNTL